jgi:hypothetical protein
MSRITKKSDTSEPDSESHSQGQDIRPQPHAAVDRCPSNFHTVFDNILSWTLPVETQDHEGLYTSGPAKMVQIPGPKPEEATLCMRISYELCQKMQEQVRSRRSRNRLKARCEIKLRELQDKICSSIEKKNDSKKQLDIFLAAAKTGMMTTKGKQKADRLTDLLREACKQLDALLAEKRNILETMSERQDHWEVRAASVEKIMEDVLVKCGLLQSDDDEDPLLAASSLHMRTQAPNHKASNLHQAFR